jgi:hypothetical protein
MKWIYDDPACAHRMRYSATYSIGELWYCDPCMHEEWREVQE